MNRREFFHNAGVTAGGASLLASTEQVRAAHAAPAGTPEQGTDALSGAQRGPWRRLFLDAMTVEESRGLTRSFHAAEKHSTSPVVRRDRPWEGASGMSGPYLYGTVLNEGGRLRMWYQCIHRGNHVGYAESADGIAWTKPNLGLIEYQGSKANNMVISALQPEVTGGVCHNPSVIHCPWESDPNRRYVLFCFEASRGRARSAYSPDGLRWQYSPETAAEGLFTSSDVVNFFWDPYRSRFASTWKTRSRRGRAAGIAFSPDGKQWTKPLDGPVFGADDLDPDATQIYGMPVFPYQGLYIGLPWIYNARYFKDVEYSVQRLLEAQENSPRTMDAQFAWSWDLINWTRPPVRFPLIERGPLGTWDGGMLFTARAPVQMGDQLYFYYGGFDKVHDEPRATGNIGLAVLRLDGFCSMNAGAEEGWLISRREALSAPRVRINARVSPGGWVRAELLDRRNRVLPGFTRDDCIPFTGDSVRHALTWKPGAPQTETSGSLSDVKVRFYLKDAALYSYWSTPDA